MSVITPHLGLTLPSHGDPNWDVTINAALTAIDAAWPTTSGTPTWGSITGTLANQTDLQTALNAKAASGVNTDITSVALGAGTALVPTFSFGSGVGFWQNAPNALVIRSGGANKFYFGTTGDFALTSANAMRWSASTDATGTADVNLTRGGVNTLQVGNGGANALGTLNAAAYKVAGVALAFSHLAGTAASTQLPTFGTAADGIVPASGGGTANFLRADGTWTTPSVGAAAPAGVDKQIQFNDSGTTAGSVDFNINRTSRFLSIGALGTATNTTNFNSASLVLFSQYFSGLGVNDNWTLQTSIGTGTNPKNDLVFTHTSGSTGGGSLVAPRFSLGAALWAQGTGSPEGVVTAPIGSLYSRTDGAAATTLYVKESGAAATGWIAKPNGTLTSAVTSVALTVPAWLSVAGSPITTAGTLAVTATAGQTANQVLATPDGVTGALAPRALVANDIPALPESKITNLTTDLAAKAPLASPALTGVPTAPTAAANANSTQLATTAYVDSANALNVKVAGDIGNTAAAPKVVAIQGVPVITTAPTDGQVLTYVSADAKWEPKTPAAGGGGGSASPTWYNPDAPAASPSALDDDFGAGSLDVKWSVATNASTTYSLTQNHLKIVSAVDTNPQLFTQPNPAAFNGTFTIACAIRMNNIGSSSTTRLAAGLYLGGATQASGGHCFGMNLAQSAPSAPLVLADTWAKFCAQWDGTSTFSSDAAATSAYTGTPTRNHRVVYLKMVVISGTATTYFSYDGIYWLATHTFNNNSFFTRVGLFVNSSQTLEVWVDWFRYYTSDPGAIGA